MDEKEPTRDELVAFIAEREEARAHVTAQTPEAPSLRIARALLARMSRDVADVELVREMRDLIYGEVHGGLGAPRMDEWIAAIDRADAWLAQRGKS